MSGFMKYGICLVNLLCLVLASCNSAKEKKIDQDTVIVSKTTTPTISEEDSQSDYEKAFMLETYLVKEKNPRLKLITITEPCAVYLFPEDSVTERLQKEYGEDFYTIADDVNWYNYESNSLLDTLKVKTLNLKSVLLAFKQNNGEPYLIDGNVRNAIYPNLFFFHPNKKPKVFSIVALEADSVKAYFDIQ